MFPSRRKNRTPDKFRMHNYCLMSVNMLLYRSRSHYETWTVFHNNTTPEQLKEMLKTKKVIIPESIWTDLNKLPPIVELSDETITLIKTQPLIVNSFGFTEEDLLTICKDHSLYPSEQASGQCPFCRIGPGHSMRVLSDKFPEGTVEGGGVTVPCIHLIWDENTELMEPKKYEAEIFKEG